MSQARVESVDAIKNFRRAWLKFAEAANVALTEAEADAVGTLRWLETEQRTWWQNQVRKTTDLVSRCEEALRHKRIFKDAAGRTPSAVDEEKALAKAKRMKEIAEEKLGNVRKYAPRLAREIQLYKGQAQRLGTFVASDIPTGAAKLDKIVQTLESYLALAAADTAVATPMAQPTEQVSSEIVTPPPADAATEPPKES
jgi:uncharacterized protein (DUF885 family)